MLRAYENEVVGLNNRMTDIHAAIGRVQLTKVDAWTTRRQENAAFLDQHLRGVRVPEVAEDATHVYHQYTVRVPADRDGLATVLRDHRIGFGTFYPTPIHRLAPFRTGDDLPETDAAAQECLSLPVHPSLRTPDLERVVAAVDAWARAGA